MPSDSQPWAISTRTLQDAILRRIGEGMLPSPKQTNPKDALSGDFEGDLVQIDGQLIKQQQTSDQYTFILEETAPSFRRCSR